MSDRLRAAWPDLEVAIEIITTTGDRVLDTPLPLLGGKGAFTEELETALFMGRIDLVVHSLKDLPTRPPHHLAIGAVVERAGVADVLVSRSGTGLFALPAGATVGTSSPRRSAQLLRARPDLRSLNPRQRRYARPQSARPGRLLRRDRAGARGSGAPGPPRRRDRGTAARLDAAGTWPRRTCRSAAPNRTCRTCSHRFTTSRLRWRRSRSGRFWRGWAAAAAPVAAYGRFENDELRLRGRVGTVDGTRQIDVQWAGACPDEATATAAGTGLAREAIDSGASSFLGAGL